MARQFRLWENAAVVSLLKPAADAGGRTSTYVSLRDCHKAFIVCYVTQGNAATIALTPLQAQDSSGTNSKAITATPIAYNLDTDTVPADQFTVGTTAANYTTDAGTKTKIVIFEIEPAECMDLTWGTNNASGVPQQFNHLAIQTGASNAANITAAILVAHPLRNARQNPITMNV